MNDEIKGFLLAMGFFILIVLIIGWCAGRCAGREAKEQYEQGYKDACVDFYQGKLKYNLIEHEDGTKTWERIKTNE